MNDQHPIDELFARNLRSAEVTPPPGVWKGVARHLDRKDRGIPAFWKRRWPLAVAVLLCGAALYPVLSGNAGEQDPPKLAAASKVRTPAVQAAAPAQASNTVVMQQPKDQAERVEPTGQAIDHPEVMRTSGAGRSPMVKKERTIASHTAKSESSVEGPWAAVSEQQAVPSGSPAAGRSLLAEATGIAPSPAAENAEKPTDRNRQQDVSAPQHEAQADVLRLGRMQPRWPSSPLATAAPNGGHAPAYVLPKTSWWLGVELGQYRESRTWHGGDPQLDRALNGTEIPHSPWSIGILGGMEGRSGWGVSIGLAYSAARFNFQHVDRVLAQTDSLVPSVITFNAQVIGSYTDTVSVYTEQQQPVAAVNRYTVFRIPVEVSWHRSWKRWRYGLRAGVAAEFGTLRSGFTLQRSAIDGGWQAVDVSADTEKRTSVLLAGSLGADIGYLVNERWSLWATPAFSGGLLPLGRTADGPYVLPERLGLRVRLAYSIRP